MLRLTNEGFERITVQEGAQVWKLIGISRGHLHPYPAGRVGLRVEIHQQNLAASETEARGEVNHRGCLTDTTFLTGNRNCSGHFSPPSLQAKYVKQTTTEL